MHCYLLPSEIQKACPPRCCSRLVIKRRKCNVWCAWVCLRSSICGSKQGLLAEKNLLPGWAESIQSIYTSPRQKSIATNLPVTQQRGQKSLATNLPSTGLAICGDLPHRIQHRAYLHNGPAMATCHKGLPKAPCLFLPQGLADQ